MQRYMFWLTGLLGLALILAPFVLSYNTDNDALWCCVILGAVMVIASLIEGLMQDDTPWEYWIIGLAGLAAIIAPFVAQYNGAEQRTQMWASFILGLLAVLLAAFEIFIDRPQSAFE